MTDIINLNSIRSDNCDCNKPKPKENSCGCHNHKPQPCYQAVDLSDQYFKVKNLFGELKSEWQRAEARSNLGIIDILGLEQTKESQESGGTNEWTMTTQKGGVTSVYKFYVKNGQKGETGPQGKSAYDVYCETTTDYPVKTPAQWLISLKGDQGEVGPAGMSAYELAQKQRAAALLPTQSLEEWLLSLKGEKGDKGDSGDGEGDKIVSVTLVNPPTTVPEGVYVWRITLKSGQTFDLWAPKEGGGSPNPNTPSGAPAIMYKKQHYDQKPTESTLTAFLEELQDEVNIGNVGKSISELQALNWKSSASTVRENDFIFMASTVIIDNNINPWTVVRLTPLDGNNGTSGDGTKGDFKSTAFARTNKNISNAQPAGGDYNRPIPSSQYYAGETIEWKDGIPDIIDGEAKVLWSTTRIFKGNGEETAWSLPTRVLDTPTYDVEFSPYSNSDGTAPNTTSNIETSNDWFDPTTDVNLPGGLTWSDMIWRAERHKNSQLESWSNWVITRIKGEKGDPGTGGDGTGKQGLTGPVIRMRGTWVPKAGRGNPGDPECYKNESNEQPEQDRIRFIDIVFYKGSYWMVNPGVTCAQPGTPPDSNSNQWTKATQFDFAYINTLIAEYINSNYIDAEEIRIHNRSYNSNDELESDIIVAGMTSGKNKNNSEQNNAGDVRIWAGSNINAGVGLYQLNVQNAPFRVTQDGNLYAGNADIKGIVQADILRLGDGSFSTCESHDAPNAVGKVLESNGNLILPELQDNKVQMFYLLTDTATSDIKVVRGKSPDTITYFDSKTQTKVTGNTDVDVSPNRLYQFFGIDHEWRVCEVTLAPLSVIATTQDGGIVDPSYYSVDTCSLIIRDEIEIKGQAQTGTLNPKGALNIQVTNLFTSDITVHIADLPLKISWQGGDNQNVSYTMDIETNGLVIPAGTQSDLVTLEYNKSDAIFSNNVFTVRISGTEEIAVKPQLNNLNVTLNDSISGSVNLDTFLIKDTDHSDSDSTIYNFTSALISATYSRGPSNITLNASSPSSQGGTNDEPSDSLWVQTNQFNVDFSPNVVYESVSVGGVGYEYLTLIEFQLGEEYITSIPETSLSTFEVSNTSSSQNIALTFPDERSIYVYIKYNRNFGTTSSDCFFYGGRLDFVFNGGIDNCTCNTFIIPPATTWKATRLSMTSDKLLYTFNENHLFSMEFKDNNSTFVNARVKKIDAIYFSYTFFDELRTPKAVNNFEHADQLISSFHFSIPEVEGITTRNIPQEVLSQLLTLNRPNN